MSRRSPKNRRRTAQAWCALLATLLAPTPGGTAAIKDQARAIEYSHRHGLYEKAFAVELTAKAPGARIFYSTNEGPLEEQGGLRYSAPIPISTTTLLRAAVFEEGAGWSGRRTETYLLLEDVLRQTGAGFPGAWGTNQGRPVPAAYRLAPEILEHPAYREEIGRGLQALPTVSIVMTVEDLFGSRRGIYAHPRESGDEWERPASVEFIPVGDEAGFQVHCGVRIQGGWSRRPEESPKHSFRLAFKKKYGAGKLKHPLFGPEGVREFDTVILRGGCNNTWLHWSSEERRRGDFIRDQWMRDSMRALGHPSARGRFVHLYLNGLYWGLYNLCERPSAPFLALHWGGGPADYDVRNGSHVLEGDDDAWKGMLALAQAGLAGAREFAAFQQRLDVPQFIDLILVNIYGANADWDRASNWYAGRRRDPPGPYRFFIWDGERTLEKLDANSLAFDDDQSPMRLFQRLRENSEFRRLFRERAGQHLANDGALTPGKAAARYRHWADALDQAVVAESARWGGYRRDVHPYKTGPYELYTRNDHWRPEVRRLLEDYFPKRTAVVREQLRSAGLYPTSLRVP